MNSILHSDIGVAHVSSDKQKGDILTKGLARPKHEPACRLIGLYPYVIEIPDIDYSTVRESLMANSCIIVSYDACRDPISNYDY